MNFSDIKELEQKLDLKRGTRQNICFTRGEGNKLFDTNDRAYIDFVSGKGENCLGYGNPWLTQAISEQAKKLINVSNQYYTEPHSALLEKMLKHTSFSRCSFTNSASDANIFAVSLIMNYLKETGDRRRAMVTVTGNDFNEAAHDVSRSINIKRAPMNDFSALKEALDDRVCALIVEPVMSGAGVIIADYDYMINAYALCKAMDILLVCNETRIGVGRTGRTFAFEHYGIQPDIVTVSRGLGGGLPIGAVLARGAVSEGYKVTGRAYEEGGTTLACEAAGIVMDRLNSGMNEEIAEKGEYLLSRLCKLKKHNFVTDIRARGLLAGIELSARLPAAKIVGMLEKQGFLLNYTERNTIRLMPPFTITEAEIDETCDAISRLFAETNI